MAKKERRRTLATDVSEAEFNNYITMANKAISPFDLEIRNTEHQISGKRTYSLINSTDNPITQLATSYTADEISYLKRVLDFMFETNNTTRKEIMAITSMDAVRLAKAPNDSSSSTSSSGGGGGGGRESQQNGSGAAAAAAVTTTQGSSGQSLTMVQAQKMLDNLLVEGWFEKSVKGFYSLSPRALMELRGWLVDTYNDVEEDEEGEAGVLKIKSCFSCKGIITVVSALPLFFFFFAIVLNNPSLPFPLSLIFFFLISKRASDVRKELVPVGCMKYALRSFSDFKSLPNAPCARLRTGRIIRVLWVSECSLVLMSTCRGREGVG